MTEWEPEPIGQSNARVWRGRGVHRKEGDPDAIAAEAERLAWLAGTGIPCPEIVEHTPGRLVTATVPGRSAGRSLLFNWGAGWAERLYARFPGVGPERLAFYRLLDEFA